MTEGDRPLYLGLLRLSLQVRNPSVLGAHRCSLPLKHSEEFPVLFGGLGERALAFAGSVVGVLRGLGGEVEGTLPESVDGLDDFEGQAALRGGHPLRAGRGRARTASGRRRSWRRSRVPAGFERWPPSSVRRSRGYRVRRARSGPEVGNGRKNRRSEDVAV